VVVRDDHTPDDAPGNEDRLGPDPPRWITKRQAAEYLGKSERTVQRLIASKKLTAHGTGAGMRLDREQINEYMRVEAPRNAAESTATASRDRGELASPVSVTSPSRAELHALGRQAHAAGIRRIFKSRVLDAAYNAEFAAALDAVDAGEVKIMSNSLRFLLGPLPDRTLFIPMWDALRRGVRFKLLLLDPFSDAARKRSEVEERVTFADDDDRFFETHLYRDILAVTRTLADPHIDFVRDEMLRQRIKSRTQVDVRFSTAAPTTHLVLTAESCFVESYHTGGNPGIEDNLMRMGIPKLECFGGFIMACMLTASCPSGELLASHFDHSWQEAAAGPSVDEVLELDRRRSQHKRAARGQSA
jgi:excisionase family DNA binding protein